jgi:4-amino-4-deoxy-L-arabinose transferase-like glycosyltransferase
MKNYRIVLLALLLVLAAVLRLWDFAAPWTDDLRGWGGSFYGNIARNYAEFSCAETKGAPVRSVNAPDSAHFEYYLDHPPMTGWLVSLSFRVFGYHEWAARLVPVLCSIGGLILLWLIMRRFWKPRTALIAMAFAAVAPMAAYYGSFVDVQGPIPFFFVLLTLHLYLRFDERRTWGRWLCVLAAFFVATLADWPVYYLVPLILVHHFFSRAQPRRQWRIILLPLLALVVLAGFVAYINWVQYGSASFDISDMLLWFEHRAVSTAYEGSGEDSWLGTILWNLRVMFTLPLLVVAATGLLFYIFRILGGERDRGDGVLAMLLAFGLLHIVIFRQGAYVHEFWGYYLYPAVVVLAAMCIVKMGEIFSSKSATRQNAFCLVLALATCAPAVVSDFNLQRTRNSTVYASMQTELGAIRPAGALVMAEENMPHYWNYRFAFYMKERVEYARACAPNLQVAAEFRPGAAILLNIDGKARDLAFKQRLLDYLADRGVGPFMVIEQPARIVGIKVTGLSPELDGVGVERPYALLASYDGRKLRIQWAHEQPDKAAHFNIYCKSDGETFFTDAQSYFSSEVKFAGETDAVIACKMRAPVTIIVTAVDSEGRETGFGPAVRIAP